MRLFTNLPPSPVRSVRLLPGVLVLGVAALAASAGQVEPPRQIVRVDFVGLDQVSVEFARRTAGVSPGEVLETPALDAAVGRLARSGRFAGVTYSVDEVDGGVSVTFRVRERITVSAVLFEGNTKFGAGELAKQVLQQVGEPLDMLSVRDGVEAIRSLYTEAGYPRVEVSFDESRLQTSRAVVYTITEGQHIRIREITFDGATAYPPKQLLRHVETKTAWWFFRAGAFDEDRVRADVLGVQKFYRDEGFLDAQVAYRTSLDESGQRMTLVFEVDEGTQYRIESVSFSGEAVFSPEELQAMVRSKVGSIVRRPQVSDDAQAIQTHYGALGYIYSRVRPIRVFANEPGLVRLSFEITEGAQHRVGRVVVRGNARTRDDVIRRELNLYPPNDLFSMTEVREAEQRLRDEPYLSSARIYPVGDEAGVRDVVIDVEESEKAGDFLFGFGITSNSGLVGSLVLDLQNFDLQDRPRSWKELYKMRAFFGGGQRLRLEFQPGTDLGRYRIDFTEPYFRNRPVRFDASLFLFERSRDEFDERRSGATLSWGRRFERGRWSGWSGEFSLRLEDVNIGGLDALTSSEITEDRGSNLLASVKGSLVRDRTDSRFVPSEGDRLRLAYEQVVGDHNFGRLTVAYNKYKTLNHDALGRKSVLRLRAEGGAIVGDAPVFEKFFAGGTGSLRGFDFRGIGEYEGLRDDNVGGDFLVLLGSEYSFPLIGDNVRGHVFFDSGTAGGGTYRASVGVGARLTINLLGPLPLEFNIAAPISSDEEDDTQVFSFLIGSLF